MRRVPFAVRLRVPVMGVTERHGWLVEGPAGWGEVSPLPSWSEAEAAAAIRSAAEAASQPFARMGAEVAVNAMVPRLAPDEAAALALASGCRTIKVKVGDAAGVDRVAAVRAAVGPAVRLRVDANGAWPVERALTEIGRLAGYDVELVEDPVAALTDLAAVRRRSPVPVAAERAISTVADAAEVRRLDAADAVVLKPQRLGGIAATLDAAQAAGVPAIASSALETSVGLATVLAAAAALPAGPFAHGVGTGLLLVEDVASLPLSPVAGLLTVRRVEPDLVAGAVRG
jgi:O-succinylbenzoate synthase